MYRPLPPYLTIANSSIDGLGLFSLQSIPCNVDLGLSHIMVEGEVVRTPLGGFYNHSENPNCEKVLVSEGKWNLFTIKDIEPGEELTVTYTLYDIERN